MKPITAFRIAVGCGVMLGFILGISFAPQIIPLLGGKLCR